ncbi:MAG: putative RNA dependent RNA polymerase [Ilomantsi totivirus 1]|nr:MAG: putative RNA dependent RNA polymerase [Ilomantsi totivirus 1]
MELTVLGRRHFRFINGELQCKHCFKLKNNKDHFQLKENPDGLTIVTPVWMLVPHVCLLSNLKIVEKFKRMRWGCDILYDRWMALNGFDYQLGKSEMCMSLWNDLDIYLRTSMNRRRLVQLDDDTMSCLESVRSVSLVDCTKYKGARHVRIDWGSINVKKDLQVLDLIWQYSSNADMKKTTLSVSQIVWHARESRNFRELFNSFLPILGLSASNVTATSIAIHCLGNPSCIKIVELINKKKICCLDSKEYLDIFKLISVALRRSSYWYDGTKATLSEVAQCAGWELAVGRSVNVSDWDEERTNRTASRMYLRLGYEPKRDEDSNAVYLTELRSVLYDILRPLIIGHRFPVSYSDFILNRQSWVSSGSTGGQRMVVEGETIRINKHVYFESLTSKEMIDWLESEPKTEAVASEKYESGKARAIYGTKPIDYAIASYVLLEIEPRMNVIEGIEAGLTGIDVLSGLMHRKLVAQERGTECSMIDYADFNIQHTLEAQACVFEVVAELFEYANAHPDKVKAAKWTAKAMLNQWCRFPLSRGYDKITQGMFSGCRQTNFLNTTLNRGYFEVALRWVRRNVDLQPIELYNIHQGDDVWISNKSRLWAMVLFKTMQESGFDFQGKKQMFDVCRAEFLRVLYSEEGCMGYLARAVASLIVKPIQSSDLGGPAERAQAINSQVNILHRRGLTAEGAEVLWRALVPYAAHVMFPRGGFSIPVNVLKLHPKNGGLGLLPPGHFSESVDKIRPLPSYLAKSKTLEAVVPKHMSEDWIKYVSKAVGRSFDAEALIEMVHASNVQDSLREKDKAESLASLEVELRIWKEKLNFPVVHTGSYYMDQFFKMESSFPDLEFRLNLCSGGFLGKRSEKRKGPIRTVNLAISLSPFKSLSSAGISLKGNWIDVAYACIGMCSHPRLAVEAFDCFNLMLRKVGPEVARFLLDGSNVGIGIFEFRWHPIMLSWVNEMARERAALDLIRDEIKLVPMAKRVVQDEFDNAIRVLNKYESMQEVCKY